jgi:hypothetical protein
MAFTPFAGTDGRIKAITVAADLTLPYPTITGTTAAISGIRKWALEFDDKMGDPIHHFESAANAYGVLWGQWLQGGTQVYKVNVEMYFDGDSASSYIATTIWMNGAFVKADFVLDKTVGTGFYGCGGKISQLKYLGPDVDRGGSGDLLSFVFLGHGALPAITTT